MNDFDHFGNGTHHSSADSYPVAKYLSVFWGERRLGSGAREVSWEGTKEKLRRYFYCAFLGSSLGVDSNVQPGVGKSGCN